MLSTGTLLQNRYQIIRQIGAGGMGAVYSAQDLRLFKLVAVKENINTDPKHFQTEAIILARLSHPNLPRVIDHFLEEDDSQYLVMDFVEGKNLADILIERSKPLSETEALLIMRQVFDAVEYLHLNDVIHRDIKPQNIIVTPQGNTVLVDFGVAKVLSSGQFTSASARVRTPGFAPPEQYTGGTTVQSDIYSLGATLYCLLTRHVPPEAPDRSAGISDLIPPRQFNNAISTNSESVIQKATNLNLKQRYSSVSAMAKSLFSISEEETKFQVSGKISRSVKIHHSINYEICCFEGHKSDINCVAFLPDGNLIASGDHDGNLRLWDWKSKNEVACFHCVDYSIASLAFSPDGKYVLIGSADEIQIWDIRNRKSIRTIVGIRDGMAHAAFSRDGKLVVGGGQETIGIWDAYSGKELKIINLKLAQIDSAVFGLDCSPTHILTGHFNSTIAIWKWNGQCVRQMKTPKTSPPVLIWDGTTLPTN